MREGPGNDKINRRDFLRTTVGASLSAFIPHGEALAKELEFLPSPFEQRDIEVQKLTAITKMLAGFWDQPKVRAFAGEHYLSGAKEKEAALSVLKSESLMYIPSSDEIADVMKRNRESLNTLVGGTKKDKCGLFIDGDTQRLYVLERLSESTIRFIKAYPVSTSQERWSNDPSSGGTPVGLHRIVEMRAGLLGEVVNASGPNGKNTVALPVREHGKIATRQFVQGLGGEGSGVAEMITRRFLIAGPTTPPSRGINIHGTNRIELLGQRGSGGCIRQSNVDITDLAQYVEVGNLARANTGEVRGGTPVMIHVSPEGLSKPAPAMRRPAWDANPKQEQKKDDLPPDIRDVTGK